jgi:hypothetical protein
MGKASLTFLHPQGQDINVTDHTPNHKKAAQSAGQPQA